MLVKFKLANYSDGGDTVYINPRYVMAVTSSHDGQTCICMVGDEDYFFRVKGTVDEAANNIDEAAWGNAGCAI